MNEPLFESSDRETQVIYNWGLSFVVKIINAIFEVTIQCSSNSRDINTRLYTSMYILFISQLSAEKNRINFVLKCVVFNW